VAAKETGAALAVVVTVAMALADTTPAKAVETEAAVGARADNNQPKSGSDSGRNSGSDGNDGNSGDSGNGGSGGSGNSGNGGKTKYWFAGDLLPHPW
jgi:hypothetical protein